MAPDFHVESDTGFNGQGNASGDDEVVFDQVGRTSGGESGVGCKSAPNDGAGSRDEIGGDGNWSAGVEGGGGWSADASPGIELVTRSGDGGEGGIEVGEDGDGAGGDWNAGEGNGARSCDGKREIDGIADTQFGGNFIVNFGHALGGIVFNFLDVGGLLAGVDTARPFCFVTGKLRGDKRSEFVDDVGNA